MAIFTGTPEQSVDLLFKGIAVEYRNLLLKKLNEVAEEVATEAAKNIATKVETYQRHIDGTVQVHVQFTGVPKKPTAP